MAKSKELTVSHYINAVYFIKSQYMRHFSVGRSLITLINFVSLSNETQKLSISWHLSLYQGAGVTLATTVLNYHLLS